MFMFLMCLVITVILKVLLTNWFLNNFYSCIWRYTYRGIINTLIKQILSTAKLAMAIFIQIVIDWTVLIANIEPKQLSLTISE